ncbi:unnamed protein product [Phytophthora fragariaefolia]|uniref:Unnamed protein product n=1 Tax=Phytophthora fragariaefolia TaxID=1490495 RepID=A0A9W6XLS2_9STRA|nr:unnamed protein product [Phytophthora fragariaefolia]
MAQAVLASELQVVEAATAVRRIQKLADYGLRYVDNTTEWQSVWSQLARRSQLSLPEFVRKVQGESSTDSRPNKALNPSTYSFLLQGYPRCAFMMRIATEGLRVRWLQQRPNQTQRPRKHRSTVMCGNRVASRIAEGEAAGTYLVVDAELFDHWDVHVSPFGAVPKGDDVAAAIRLIHDLSHPFPECRNEFTAKSSLPPVQYEHIAALVRRIDLLRARFPTVEILMLKGDVNGVFRHMRHHTNDVGWMCGKLPQLHAEVVDLSAPFGWPVSPAIYGIFGRVISFLVGERAQRAWQPT